MISKTNGVTKATGSISSTHAIWLLLSKTGRGWSDRLLSECSLVSPLGLEYKQSVQRWMSDHRLRNLVVY